MHPLSKNGTIAQLVEQRTENPCVPGSIPGGTTYKTKTQLIINQLRFSFLLFAPHLIAIREMCVALLIQNTSYSWSLII